MRIIITSGATFAPWDNVRGITNLSKGTTGAKIAEQALLRGHSVDYIANGDTKQPFDKEFKIDPTKNSAEVIKFLQSEKYTKIKEVYKNYTYQKAPTFNDYLKLCLDIPDLRKDEKPIFIASAAVSDYAPKQEKGKVSSSEDNITLQLRKLPKVIKEVKTKFPNMPLVGFKLLSTETSNINDLINIAQNNIKSLDLSLVVANLVDANFRPKYTAIITSKQEVIDIEKREDLAPRLIAKIEEDFGETPKL